MKNESLKSLARELGKALKAKGRPVPHSVLLHALAAMTGESDWHVLAAHRGRAVAPTVAGREAATGDTVTLPLWTALYEHRHGTDSGVFVSKEAAEAWRTRIAEDWWSDEFPDQPVPSGEMIGEEYFRRLADSDRPETFTIEQGSTLELAFHGTELRVNGGPVAGLRVPPTPPAPPVTTTVWVARYRHPYGTDVQVFTEEALAHSWRTAIATHWWAREIDEDPPTDEDIGRAYFRIMNDRDEPENFDIEQLPVLSAPVVLY